MAGMLQVKIDPQAVLQENFKILQRIDSSIVRVLGNAAHTAIYTFQQEKKEWKRKDTEGPFFIEERQPTKAAPHRFAIIVLNRINATNYEQAIAADITVAVNDPYIILRTKEEFFGFWFANANERNTVSALLQNLLLAVNQQQQQQQQQSQQAQASQHLMSLLQGAGVGASAFGQRIAAFNNGGPQYRQQTPNVTPDEVELTKPQLQQMLIRMLKDDRFIGLLHQQYVQSLRKKRQQPGPGNR